MVVAVILASSWNVKFYQNIPQLLSRIHSEWLLQSTFLSRFLDRNIIYSSIFLSANSSKNLSTLYVIIKKNGNRAWLPLFLLTKENGVLLTFHQLICAKNTFGKNCWKVSTFWKAFAIFLFLQYPGLRWSYMFVINLSSYKTSSSLINLFSKQNFIHHFNEKQGQNGI